MRVLQPLHPGRARIVMKRELITQSVLAHKLICLDLAHTPPFRLHRGENGLEIYDHNKEKRIKLKSRDYSIVQEPPSLLVFPANPTDRPGAHNLDDLIRALSGGRNAFTSSNAGLAMELQGEIIKYQVEAIQFYILSDKLVKRVRSPYQDAR